MALDNKAAVESTFSSSIQCDVENTFDYFDSADPLGSMQRLGQLYVKRKEDELNEKRVVSDGFEQKYTLDYYRIGKREAKKRRKSQVAGTAGDDWFHMKAPEITDEIKRDLEVIQMRRALFRDHQYKRRATDKAPEHFQIGTVVEGSGDYYSSRLTRKERSKTLVDELLKDASFQRNAKQRYERIAMVNVDKKKARALRKKQSKRRELVRKKSAGKEWKNRSEAHRLDKRKESSSNKDAAKRGKSLKGAKKHQKRLKKNK
jgi:hypothetical protein